MSTFSRFEEIKAWRLARRLTKEVYESTKRDGFRQDMELRGQIRAASGSIMHNIAEGFDAGSDAECARFLGRLVVQPPKFALNSIRTPDL